MIPYGLLSLTKYSSLAAISTKTVLYHLDGWVAITGQLWLVDNSSVTSTWLSGQVSWVEIARKQFFVPSYLPLNGTIESLSITS